MSVQNYTFFFFLPYFSSLLFLLAEPRVGGVGERGVDGGFFDGRSVGSVVLCICACSAYICLFMSHNKLHAFTVTLHLITFRHMQSHIRNYIFMYFD